MGLLVLIGHVTLDGIMFDNFFFSPFLEVIVRVKAYVLPQIFDVVLMHVVVKGGVFQFIGCRHMNNWMALCELHQ